MKTYENLEHNGEMGRISMKAEAALELYGLAGAEVTLLGEPGSALFRVEVPVDSGLAYHPYLGKIAGKRFLLRLQNSGTSSAASLYAELVCLAALLRDTDLDLPEPVPAFDGSLVAEMYDERTDNEPQLCVLFRWTSSVQPADRETPGWPELAAVIEEIYGGLEIVSPVPAGSALN